MGGLNVQDKYINRRRMAWWAFRLVVLVGVPVLVFGLFSDANAARVEKMNFFLGTIFGVWISIILAYFGSTTITDNKEPKQ